jgi:hypothetical protein
VNCLLSDIGEKGVLSTHPSILLADRLRKNLAVVKIQLGSMFINV